MELLGGLEIVKNKNTDIKNKVIIDINALLLVDKYLAMNIYLVYCYGFYTYLFN